MNATNHYWVTSLTGQRCGLSTRSEEMAEYERNDTTTEDLRDEADDAGDAIERGADKAKEGSKSVADRASDVIEDVIPGDSDHDGH